MDVEVIQFYSGFFMLAKKPYEPPKLYFICAERTRGKLVLATVENQPFTCYHTPLSHAKYICARSVSDTFKKEVVDVHSNLMFGGPAGPASHNHTSSTKIDNNVIDNYMS